MKYRYSTSLSHQISTFVLQFLNIQICIHIFLFCKIVFVYVMTKFNALSIFFNIYYSFCIMSRLVCYMCNIYFFENACLLFMNFGLCHVVFVKNTVLLPLRMPVYFLFTENRRFYYRSCVCLY